MLNDRKLAVVGASYLQKPLVEKAKEMGLYVICFAWKEGAVCAELADEFYPISIVEKEQILDVCKEKHIDGICTIASDVAAPTVAYVAEHMGLVGNSYEAAVRANNKYLMREAFSKAGVPCPGYCMIDDETKLDSIGDLGLPLIVKPSDRSGSLGVMLVTDHEQLKDAVDKAISVSFKRQAMVEEFIAGREISVEFISYNGAHYPLTITDKVTTGAPHFVELEHHQPANLSEEQYDEIYRITKKALTALGVTNGASHSEYKITDDGRICIIEIGARMGGDFIGSDLVRLSTGYDFVQGVIDVALGKFNAPIINEQKCSGVYFLCKETEWLRPYIIDACGHPQIVKSELTDETLRSVTCSADRSGYLTYQSEKKWIPGRK